MIETVYRFRVIKHEDMSDTSESRQASLRERGIDPKDKRSLYASAADEETANAIARDSKQMHDKISADLGYDPVETFSVVDGGEETTIERADF